MKNFTDKPDIFLTIRNVNSHKKFGLCRSGKHDNISHLSYHDQPVNFELVKFEKDYIAYIITENYDKMRSFRSLNYDAAQEWIIYLSTEVKFPHNIQLIKQNLRNSSEEQILYEHDGNSSCIVCKNIPIDITYDWIKTNVYISNNTFVSVFNIKTPGNLTKIISNRSEIVNIVVHPFEGYIYFIDLKRHTHNNSVSNAVYRANLDGSNIVKITEPVDTKMSALVIDFYTDRLYWRLLEEESIYHSKLDGSDVKRFHNSGTNVGVSKHHWGATFSDIPGDSHHSISFDKDYLYYVSRATFAVQRLRKADYQEDPEFILYTGSNDTIIEELVIYDPEVQKMKCSSAAKL